MSPKPTWSGRVKGGRDPDVVGFLDGEWDEHLIAEEDVCATIAHVRVLAEAGVLRPAEAKRLIGALQRLELPALDDFEDVHSAVEHVLTEHLGEVGARVHAGRSRNDLVATDLRLAARRIVLDLLDAVLGLREALIDRAQETARLLAPGYTHLQRAQPITVGHWLLAHAEALRRDTTRLLAAHEAADSSPLGAGALAGNTLGLRPEVGARALGFSRAFANSLDAVTSRDFLADACFASTSTATDLSRLGEEIVLWSTAEFGFIRLPDTVATGSSMMPQKRNPDVAELSRAEVGAALGALVDLVVTVKSTPYAYNRDLQASKRALHPLRRAAASVRAMTAVMRAVVFDAERLRDAVADDFLLATDLAEALVARRVPFRRAHEMVAGVVRHAEKASTTLREALERSPQALRPLEVDEALALLDPAAAVERRATPGGPSRRSVRAQITAHRRALKADRQRHGVLAGRLPDRRSAAGG